MTITELNQETLKDLVEIDQMLVLLARYENEVRGDTSRADMATRAINRIATRYGIADTEAERVW